MKFFNLFKSKKSYSNTAKKKCDGKAKMIQYESKMTARSITKDSALIQSAIDRMIKEDPFKNYYTGKTDADFGPMSKRVYKYDAVTTVNVNLVSPDDHSCLLYVEGISLGEIPDSEKEKIDQYKENCLLTAYAYVTGGPYKEYSEAEQSVVELEDPYGLDIYIQFT